METQETKIRKVVRSEITEALKKKNAKLLLEYSYRRKEYKDRFDALIPQILTNWCLVRHCSLTGKNENLKHHWQTELLAHMLSLSAISLKGNNSAEARRKAIMEVLDDQDVQIPNTLDLIVSGKFFSEDIQTDTDEYNQTLSDCIKSLGDIVDAILSKDKMTILQYVKTKI